MDNGAIITMDQAIIRARNLVVSKLAAAVAIPVRLSDEQDPEAPPPYCYYSFISPYVPTGEFGNHTRQVIVDPETQTKYIRDVRAEYPEMILSFTFCSRNRQAEKGEEINGETEALQLAAKAAGWFVQEGGFALSMDGLAVLRVNNLASRSGILADEYVRRWGFDVAIRYKAQTIRIDGIIERVITKQNK